SGGDGMIVTEGGRFGGYGFYVLKGKPVFVYNFVDLERFRWEGPQALTPGKHTLVFDFRYNGQGFGKGGTGTLKVDNKEVARRQEPHTAPFITDLSKATADDLRGLYGPLVGNAGVYEIAGNQVTIRPVVAKIPIVMKPGAYEVYEFKVENNNLTLTQRRNVRGPVERGTVWTLRRVE